MTRPFFSKERISDFQLFDEHVQVTLKLLRTRLQEGHAVDFQVSGNHPNNSAPGISCYPSVVTIRPNIRTCLWIRLQTS